MSGLGRGQTLHTGKEGRRQKNEQEAPKSVAAPIAGTGDPVRS
jgi:hypothetical protein